MKRLLVLIFIIVACQNEKTKDKTIAETDNFIDSIDRAKKVDSIVKATMRSAYFDTSNISTSPVKILSTRIVKEEYSSYRAIALTWKNISNKRIDAIKFKWYGFDAFNEPADMGTGIDGLDGGMTDNSLSPGKTGHGQWQGTSRNVKRVYAWPYEVAFADGTFWKQRQ